MGARALRSRQVGVGAGALRRRIGLMMSLTLVALSGVECVQDLFVSPKASTCALAAASPQNDTLNIGDTLSLPSVRLTCGSATPSVGYRGELVAGTGVLAVDTVAGRMVVLGPGTAQVRVRPVSPALAVDTLYVEFTFHAAVPVLASTGQDSIFSLKDTLQLTAQPRSSKGVALSGISVRWQLVSGTSVSLLDTTGRVRAEANGDAVLKAVSDTATVTRTVHVSQKAASVAVSPAGATLVGTAATQTLAVQARDARGNGIASISPAWTSLNPSVATVGGSTGVATAVANGEAVVSATVGGVTGYAMLIVATPSLAAASLWSETSSNVTALLHGVWGTSQSNVYAVGAGGNILRWNGSGWSAMASGTSAGLWGVWGTSQGKIGRAHV